MPTDHTSIITRLPLRRLTTPAGEAKPLGTVGVEGIRRVLRVGPVRFVVADVGHPLEWISEAQCFDYWKGEVLPHLAEPNHGIHLEHFPNQYAYLASQWDDGATPIILLSKVH